MSRSVSSLEAAGELFRTAFDEAPIGMCLVGPDGRFLRVNGAFARMMGYSPEELVELRVADVTHPDDRPHNLKLLRDLVSGALDRYEIRKLNLRRDGSAVPVLVTVAAVRDDGGQLRYIVAQIQDLTEKLAAERALRDIEDAHRRLLERQARQDLLTGLPNRRALADRLTAMLERVRTGAGGGALLFCDLDNFKAVNDAWGHAVGDQLLVAVASRLERSFGADVVRFGGDEFVVLVPDVITAAAAEAAGQQFSEVFRAPFYVVGREFAITASVGVAIAPPGSKVDADNLLRNADTAMYRAKHIGRDRVVVFTDALRRELLERVKLESDLRSALARRELFCHFQPLVDLRDWRIFRAEALVRWRHPERGVLPPSAFMAGVERAGLASPLGDQVLAFAAERAGGWWRAGEDISVAVNLSAQQIRPGLPEAVGRLVERHGLPPQRLCLELTESTLFETQHESLAVLHELAARGVCLAVDDFGTGYSSFAYLRDLPVHEVKLDRSFVLRLDDGRTERVVAGMIHLAHELGLKVVAEGVETQRQLDLLLDLECDAAQGYLFAVPSDDPLAPLAPRPTAVTSALGS